MNTGSTQRPGQSGRPRRLVVQPMMALGVALLAACGSGTTMPGQTPDDVRELYPEIPGAALQLQAQALAAVSTPVSQIPDARRTVLKTTQEWQQYWDLFYGNVSPTPQPVQISFSADMVVVATSGTKPSGGYGILIEGVFESGGEVLVAVLETSPAAGCSSIAVISAPATAVMVQSSDLPVRFVERSESVPCS